MDLRRVQSRAVAPRGHRGPSVAAAERYSDSIQNPVLLNQIIESAKSAYAAQIYRGKDDKTETFSEILTNVIGDSASVNGYKVPTFIGNNGKPVSRSTFERLFKGSWIGNGAFTIDDLKNTGQDNLLLPDQLDIYRDYGRVYYVGVGKYNILLKKTKKFLI